MKITVAAFAAIMALGLSAHAQPTEEATPAAPADAAAPEEAAPAEPAKPAKPPKPVSYFVGIFQGDTTVQQGAGAGSQASTRQSRVEITADGTGFVITWATLYVDDDNPAVFKIKDSTKIGFRPTTTPGAYGQADAGALWTGKPYYWARIEGDTLNVSALVLDADGSYDVTHYARTLQGDTMRLEFTRFKDGMLDRTVTGTLTRTTE
jgi:hypothetical protein